MDFRRLHPRHFVAVACACVFLTLALWSFNRIHGSNLPPATTFYLVRGDLTKWKAYGGAWESVDGAIHNNSDERGAKLLTGITRWTDYTFQVDLRLDGNSGDIGVVVRSNNEEEGVDAYRGYYAGLRTTDGSLVIGHSDYGWVEARPVPMPGGVNDASWYRVTVTAFQCWIAAEAQNLTTLQTASVVLEEHPCVESGRLGLRSLGTGGKWRNISLRPAGLKDYQRIRQHVVNTSKAEFPKREGDYNRMLSSLPPISSGARLSWALSTAIVPPTHGDSHIGDILDQPLAAKEEVTVRGAVTLTSPELYIQDQTGGILVTSNPVPTLNVGDVVEVHGYASHGFYSARINGDTVHRLWNGPPTPPVSITPSQAASGRYDAQFVETEGYLSSEELSDGGRLELHLTDGVQSFLIASSYPLDQSLRRLDIDSYLRVRGVCVVNPTYTHGLTPFVILLNSGEDVQMLVRPPWWNPIHTSVVFACVLVAALLLQVLFFRVQRWNYDSVTRERDRIAHDIHDTMAQSFAGLGYQIQGIRRTVLNSSRVDAVHVSDQLTKAYEVVRHCHQEASRTINMLSSGPPQFQEDLLGALAEMARRIAGDQIRTITHVEGNVVPLHLRTATALLDIGREAIANAEGHSSLTELRLTLHYEERWVELIIEDNGGGFEFTQEKAGFGILSMQKRARDIGSVLRISSTPGCGTKVHLKANLLRNSLSRQIVKLLKTKLKFQTRRRDL